MTYEELKAKLESNLAKLQKMYERWEAELREVVRYQDYITSTLHAYRVIEWITDQ